MSATITAQLGTQTVVRTKDVEKVYVMGKVRVPALKDGSDTAT